MTHASLMLERIENFSWWYGQGVANLHIMGWVGYSRELELLGSLRYGDYGLRLRINMLLRMIKTT